MIVSSFQTQYGLRVARVAGTMPWGEFRDLLAGLSADTPLGRLIAIRAETDPEVLKHFTPQQRAIRAEWRTRSARKKSEQDTSAFLDLMQTALARMAGASAKKEEEVTPIEQ